MMAIILFRLFSSFRFTLGGRFLAHSTHPFFPFGLSLQPDSWISYATADRPRTIPLLRCLCPPAFLDVPLASNHFSIIPQAHLLLACVNYPHIAPINR